MFLVQFLLPLYGNSGQRFPADHYTRVTGELTERYGGVTAYLRSPGNGAWKAPTGEVDRDDVVMFEVMVDSLDREWWASYRKQLEKRFSQEALVVRATAFERL
jgi:hypothetical protein